MENTMRRYSAVNNRYNHIVNNSYVIDRILHIIKNINMIKLSLITITLVVFMWVSIVIVSGSVTTGNTCDISRKDVLQGRCYITIDVNKNDTLWSIADRYNNTTQDRTAYINSLKQLNNIEGDTIYAGDSIIVYYYIND